MKKLILSAIVLSMATMNVMAEDAAEDANKHWTKSGNASLQFTQGYVSKNWYKGGVSSFALLGTADYTFNYKYNKFAWDNAIEAKLGFVNASSQYRTFITKYNNPEKLLSTYYEGQELGELWGYEIDGLFQTQEEVDDYLTKVDPVNSMVYTDIVGVLDSKAPGLHPGDVRYVDLNGDGVITSGNNTADNPGDRRIIGNTLPKYNYNFHISAEWYGVDLSIHFQGVGRRDWYPMTEATTFWGPYSRPYQGFMAKDFMTNVWSEDNPDAYFPRYRAYEALGSANSLGPANTRYMLNVGYLRMKNITVGYTLPCWKNVFSEFRIYFSAENPWCWSQLQKYCRSIDPEQAVVSSQAITYGFARTFTFGLTATF